MLKKGRDGKMMGLGVKKSLRQPGIFLITTSKVAQNLNYFSYEILTVLSLVKLITDLPFCQHWQGSALSGCRAILIETYDTWVQAINGPCEKNNETPHMYRKSFAFFCFRTRRLN